LHTASPPPFIHINDSFTPRRTSAAINSCLSSSDIHYAAIDAIQCFSPRLLFDTALNAFAKHEAEWEDGVQNWGTERHNESLDAFLHELRAVGASLSKQQDAKLDDLLLVLFVENVERWKDSMPEVVVPLTRL
jgi:origin recognition complex subunit 5